MFYQLVVASEALQNRRMVFAESKQNSRFVPFWACDESAQMRMSTLSNFFKSHQENFFDFNKMNKHENQFVM